MLAPKDVYECDVALVIGELPPRGGGAERQIIRLASSLAEEGRRVLVIGRGCSDIAVPLHPSVKRIDPLRSSDAGAVGVESRVRRVFDARLWRPLRRRSKSIERRILDVLIVRLIVSARSARRRGRLPSRRDQFLFYAGRRRLGAKFTPFDKVLRRLRADCVVTFLPFPNIYGAVSLWDSKSRLVISNRNDPRLSRKGEPFDSMAYLAHVRADLVTANSVGALETLGSLPELSTRRVELSPNIGEGVVVERPGLESHFLVVGRLRPHKRVGRAVDIFAEVADQTPGWDLLIAGQGPEEEPLRARVAELGLQDRVRFLGFVDDMPGLLREGGVLLHLSAYEGTPNAIMEAMAAGVPVIVTDRSPGPVELVEGEGSPSGVVCEDGDWAGIGRAMIELASDAALRQQFGHVGLRRAKGWSWPAVRNDWLRILGLNR